VVIAVLWVQAPLGSLDKRISLFGLLTASGLGWITGALLVFWLIDEPIFDQLFMLPVAGAIIGGGIVLTAHDQQWVERLRWRYEMYRQTRGRKTR
jgi:hypothetical protein